MNGRRAFCRRPFPHALLRAPWTMSVARSAAVPMIRDSSTCPIFAAICSSFRKVRTIVINAPMVLIAAPFVVDRSWVRQWEG